MSKVRVCFLGTPDFAATALKSMLEDDHFEIVGVISQPDRPAGRKMVMTASPVKTLALSHGLKILTPESVNKDFMIEQIKSWSAEVAVVVAFGQILSLKFLEIFRFGAVNIHGSLLPKWRGAAPIQRSLEAGDSETGVTLQKIVKALDAGDIIGIRKVTVDESMQASDLFPQLAKLGCDLLHVELMDYVRGNLSPVPQDHSAMTVAKKIDKAEAKIDFNQSAEKIHNKVRAFNLGPGTFTFLNGKKIKILKTSFTAVANVDPAKTGKVTDVTSEFISIQTGAGILKILELQPESRNKMSVSEFLKGHDFKIGDIFGN